MTPPLLPPGPPSPDSGKAEALYRALLERTTNRVKRGNLEHVWQALETMRARQHTVFTPAEVVKMIRALNLPGPKEQSIRNRGQGDDFQALIKTYAAEHSEAKRRPSVDADDDLAAAIGDQRIAARVRLLQARARALQHRNDILHQQYQRLEAAPPTVPAPALPAAPDPRFTEREVQAVAHFLGRLEVHGWTPDEASGALIDHHGFEVAPPHFLGALRKVAARG